jgi:hypothetical protein
MSAGAATARVRASLPALDLGDADAVVVLSPHGLSSVGGVIVVARDLWKSGGSCGAGPLMAVGTLFSGRRADVLAYERPSGVGHLVATVAW